MCVSLPPPPPLNSPPPPPPAQSRPQGCHLRSPVFPFFFKDPLKDSPRAPGSTNHQPPPTATNRHQPPTTVPGCSGCGSVWRMAHNAMRCSSSAAWRFPEARGRRLFAQVQRLTDERQAITSVCREIDKREAVLVCLAQIAVNYRHWGSEIHASELGTALRLRVGVSVRRGEGRASGGGEGVGLEAEVRACGCGWGCGSEVWVLVRVCGGGAVSVPVGASGCTHRFAVSGGPCPPCPLLAGATAAPWRPSHAGRRDAGMGAGPEAGTAQNAGAGVRLLEVVACSCRRLRSGPADGADGPCGGCPPPLVQQLKGHHK